MKQSHAPRFARHLIAMAAAMALLPAHSAVISWSGANNGFWDISGNWTPALPGPLDDVLLAAFDTEFRSGAVTIRTLTGTGRLTLSGGSLSMTNASSIGAFSMTGGIVAGTGALTISGASTWTGGSMSGAGSTTFNGALVLSGNVLRDITGRAVNFAGTTTWTNIAGGNGGQLRTGSGAVLTNSGTFLDQTAFDTSINANLGGVATSFVNSGVYTKSGATTTTVTTAFNNAATGVVNVNVGTLTLGGGGTSAGAFHGGGTLGFSGGTHDLSGASNIDTGNVIFNGGTTNVGGSYSVAGTTTVSGGTANLNGSVANVGSALVVSAGAMNFSNSAGVTMGTLNLSGGAIGGTQSLTMTGASTWTGGSMSGTGSTTFNGALVLSGNVLRDITGRAVNFAGTTTWTNIAGGNGGQLRTGSGAVLTNSGTFLDQTAFDTSINANLGGVATSFVNSGVYTKSGATTTTVTTAFNNAATGVVNVNVGTLTFGGGGTSSGTFNVASGATLGFSGGTHDLSGVVAGSGSGRMLVSSGIVNSSGANAFGGQLAISSGTMNVGGAFGAASYDMTGGIVAGTGALTISGASTWTGGSMSGAGSTTFNGALVLSGNVLRDITGRAVNFAGTTTWTNIAGGNGGQLRTGSGAVLTNSGTFLDQTAFDTSINANLGGAPSSFVNNGAYTKSGASTTGIATVFNNGAAGVVNVNVGTLALSGGGISSGTFDVASGATLGFAGGTHNLSGVVAGSGTGRMLVSGGIVNSSGVNAFGGQLAISGGTMNANGTFSAAGFDMTGGIVAGTGALTISGAGSWTNGGMSGTGSTTFNGAMALSGNGLRDITGRAVNFAGTTTWTTAAGGNLGQIRTGSGAVLTNSGNFLDQTAFDTSINANLGGAPSSFVNNGAYTKSGATTTTISTAFNNVGTTTVTAGVLSLTGGLTNFNGATLTGGTYNVIGASTLQFSGANIVTDSATILLDGAGSKLLNATNSANALTNLASVTATGSFTIRNGRNFTSVGAFNNAGIVNVGSLGTFTAGGAFTNTATSQLQLAGGSFAGPSLANAGLVTGFGTVVPAVANTGSVVATSGALTLAGGVQGNSGSVTTNAGATLTLGAPSNAATLLHNGTLLALGSSNVTVFQEYNNASFGVGNAFDRRAGVSGTGLLLAAGTVLQTVSGSLVLNGNTGTPSITFGNVHVGDSSSRSFVINNVGANGPSLRGAIQSTGITSTSLSGSGVTAQNWGALAQGSSTGPFTVTYAPAVAGALAGQTIAIVNNFDNVAGQTLAVNGSAYRLAQAGAINAVAFGNVHVGEVVTQALTISNIAAADGFSEKLGASFGAVSDVRITTSGSVGLLAAGATNALSMAVGVNTSAAGNVNGTATVKFVSDGNGTSGLGQTALPSQFVAVSADISTVASVFRLAAPSAATPNPVNFGNVRIGTVSTQALSITNIATNDGFSEKLNASFSSATAGVTATGSFNLLGAQAANNSSLVVGIDTSSAGAKSGSAVLALASDGTGTSNLGLTTLASQTINVSGTVFRIASAAAASPSPVVLANQRVGGTLTQALTLTNTAAADGFSEKLNASLGSATGSASATGAFTLLAAGASNSSALVVGVSTTTAGAKTGSATLTLTSDGLGTSGLGAIGIGTQAIAISGDVYRVASAGAAAPNPVTFANQRVGGTMTQSLTVANTAAVDGFSEKLNAGFSGTSGSATAAGSFSLLAAGASNASALVVGLDTSTAGAKSGSATIAFASDGTGTSGFSVIGVGSQSVSVSGNVYRLATSTALPAALVIGNTHVGGALSQIIFVGNSVAADGFSERLNASFSGTTGQATATGVASLLGAGLVSNALSVAVDTSSAGAKVGSATIALASDGTGTSGFAALGIGAQVVNVSGTVVRYAVADTVSAVAFGNVHVGDVVTQALTIRNLAAADGFSDRLTASFGAVSDARITTSGSVSRLAAGATDAASMVVGLNTSAAGNVSGTATVDFLSDGIDFGLGRTALASQSVGVTANISTVASVFRLAAPSAATPNPVNFGNVRIGTVNTQALSITNTAANDGFSEKLNASLGGASAGITASGSFNLLSAQATNSTSLVVGLDSSSAGVKSGSATVALASDGTGTSNLGLTTLASQTVNVAGTVYRLASPALNTPNVTLAARVGDAAPSASISLTNTSPDAFTERLNASLGAVSAGFTGSGSVSGLGAGASSSALGLALNTASAGSFSGTAGLNFVSSGAGTTGAVDLALTAQLVTLTGKVYAPAVAQVNSSTVDFGIVHKGDAVAARNVSVTNSAAITGPNDTLRGSLGGAGAPFSAGGTLAGVAAQATDNTSFFVGLNTGAAGVFTGSATASFASHDGDLADLSLGTATVALKGQVNNFAEVALTKSGAGALSLASHTYTLDFGTLLLGSGNLHASFAVLNNVVGPADLLNGDFDLTGLGTGFTLSGFGSFADLVAGASASGLDVAFLGATGGTFMSQIVLHASGHNASGYIGTLADTTLVLKGNVSVVAVPEPGTYVLMFAGLLVVVGAARRRARQQAPAELAA